MDNHNRVFIQGQPDTACPFWLSFLVIDIHKDNRRWSFPIFNRDHMILWWQNNKIFRKQSVHREKIIQTNTDSFPNMIILSGYDKYDHLIRIWQIWSSSQDMMIRQSYDIWERVCACLGGAERGCDKVLSLTQGRANIMQLSPSSSTSTSTSWSSSWWWC